MSFHQIVTIRYGVEGCKVRFSELCVKILKSFSEYRNEVSLYPLGFLIQHREDLQDTTAP